MKLILKTFSSNVRCKRNIIRFIKNALEQEIFWRKSINNASPGSDFLFNWSKCADGFLRTTYYCYCGHDLYTWSVCVLYYFEDNLQNLNVSSSDYCCEVQFFLSFWGCFFADHENSLMWLPHAQYNIYLDFILIR